MTNDNMISPEERWWNKLITKEDLFMVHKILAILALSSFAWRLVLLMQLDPSFDMGFASHPHWTLPTLVLHLALNLSSFQFHIPSRRITSGYRIWPEYRLHSLIFTARPVGLIFWHWWLSIPIKEHGHAHLYYDSSYYGMVNLAIQLCTVAAADVASWSVGKYHSQSIRGLPVSRSVQFFFSVMQFFGATGILMGYPRGRCSGPFMHIIVVQGNAFLMTLRRKNLASQFGLLVVYSIALAVGFTVTVWELFFPPTIRNWRPLLCFLILSSMAAFLRLGGPEWLCIALRPKSLFTSPSSRNLVVMFLKNKYVIWASMGYIWLAHLGPFCSRSRQEARGLESQSPAWLWSTALLSLTSLLALSVHKCIEPPNAADKSS